MMSPLESVTRRQSLRGIASQETGFAFSRCCTAVLITTRPVAGRAQVVSRVRGL
jgi:hypothetical protein